MVTKLPFSSSISSKPNCPLLLSPYPIIPAYVLNTICLSPAAISWTFFTGTDILWCVSQWLGSPQMQNNYQVISCGGWFLYLSLNFYFIILSIGSLFQLGIIKLSTQTLAMYNRYLHLKEEQRLNQYVSKSRSLEKMEEERKNSNQKMGERYKERVRDFLVKITSKPIVLGQYQPPIMHIVRNPEVDKIRANAQLYINGFKTNKERVASKVQENKILDLNPTRSTALLHDFRPRAVKQEIQPGMKFAGRAYSETKLPRIQSKSSLKLRFKGVQEMGNNLKSLKPNLLDEIGLVNRLQTVSGGKELNHLAFSMIALRESKLIKNKYKAK